MFIFPVLPNKYKIFATRVRICLNKTEVNVDYERKVGMCTVRVNGEFR